VIRLFISFYLILAVCYVGFQLVGEAVEEGYFQEWVNYDKENDYIGLFHILDELHGRLGISQLHEIVDSFPDISNIPIETHKISELKIDEKGLELLRQGEIYVQDNDSDILYYRLKRSDLVVRVGPMQTYERLEELSNWYNQMFFLVLGVSALLWILNLQLKFNRLNKAAVQFGEGNFSVRVSEKGRHKIGKLNHSFNTMADRIDTLIKGHKSLTSAVAHELRTPVARMRFQLDMMHQEKDEKQRTDYIYGMSDDLNELGELVDELLTYARFDREAPAINMQAHSLHKSLLSVISARHLYSDTTIFYDDSWFMADPALEDVPFEPKHLERAIGNLVSNAQKYTQSKVQIQVQRNRTSCTIYVDDDGPGIPESDRDSIFEPFRRLDDSRTRSTGGYGLGLAIVKQIAQWHDGEVRISQAPIGGARFIFTWPLSGLTNQIKS